MRKLLTPLLVAFLAAQAQALVVYNQPHQCCALHQSSWIDPDGSPWDQYIWDAFTLSANHAITEVRWRGGYIYGGSYGGPVYDFTVAIYPSIAGGSQPDVTHPPLVTYDVGGNAGETFAGTFGGVAMYDYRFVLPSPFQASGGTRYWLQIYGWQTGIPEWGLAGASGGDGNHFRRLEYQYQNVPGDTTFSLLSSDAPTYNITATASPPEGGTIQGAGAYPQNSTVTLVAHPNTGFGFLIWTENNTVVSNSATYSFTATRDRTLVAHFIPAYTITTSAFPTYGGTTTGDGIYNSGSNVTVSATAHAGFIFVDWTEYGNEVSTSPVYSFVANADRPLVANFVTDPLTVAFDFDNAPIHTSLPIDLTVNNLTAHLSATGQGFSIQEAGTMGFTPAGFAGLCIYPNSVFAADLHVSYSERLTYFSIMYSPQELGCDSSARMRVTAYRNGAQVGTNTTTAPFPGTWPTGTLTISVASGFDSVVVHYDARPPTCQDWGPIFLADNMIVTRACDQIVIAQQPFDAGACASGSATFWVGAVGCLPLAYHWQAELDPGVWTGLTDGNLVHQGRVIAVVSGATNESVQFAALGGFNLDRSSLNLRCNVTNPYGSSMSSTATLTVWPTGTGDANGDGWTDGDDISTFVDFVFNGGAPGVGMCACDFNGDGWTDAGDVPGFVARVLGP